MLRHTARQQIYAMLQGPRMAASWGAKPEDVTPAVAASYAAAILIASSVQVRQPGHDWHGMKSDDVLDLDADDFGALNAAGGDDAPGPPSPTS